MVERDTYSGSSSTRLYVEQDADYNVTSLSNSSGGVVERYTYDPYGSVTVMNAAGTVLSGSAYGWIYLSQGLRLDAASGLYQDRFRPDKNPVLGRFDSEDPAGTINGMNEYQDEESNSVRRLDPDGLAVGVAAAPGIWAYLSELAGAGASEGSVGGPSGAAVVGVGAVAAGTVTYGYIVHLNNQANALNAAAATPSLTPAQAAARAAAAASDRAAWLALHATTPNTPGSAQCKPQPVIVIPPVPLNYAPPPRRNPPALPPLPPGCLPKVLAVIAFLYGLLGHCNKSPTPPPPTTAPAVPLPPSNPVPASQPSANTTNVK